MSAPPPMTPQTPFFVVMNSGSGSQEAQEREATLREVLEAGGRRCELLIVEDPKTLAATAKRAVKAAVEHEGVVGVAGGDGTINAVAQHVLGCGRPFAIFPQGTFNFFGRSHRISEDTATAARGVLTGKMKAVQVGTVNDVVFLVNASLGLYPRILKDREGYKQRYGRSRAIALWAGLRTMLRGHHNLRLDLRLDGKTRRLHSPTLVVDNNRLQLENIGVAQAPDVEHGQLVGIAVRPISTVALIGLAVRGLLGQLGESDQIETFAFTELVVRPRLPFGLRRIRVAVDGEIIRLTTPLRFRPAPEHLYVLGADSAERDDAPDSEAESDVA